MKNLKHLEEKDMKNLKIEAFMKQVAEIENKFGEDSKEAKDFYKENKGAWNWVHSYFDSIEKGFDEIVVTGCLFNGDIPDFIEYGKKFGIGWFVFASGSTGAFETIDAFLQNGARMGKFVVKEYSEKRFHSEETIRVPGVRINL